MKISDLRKRRNRKPFCPFRVRLSSGELLTVEHFENLSVQEDEEEMKKNYSTFGRRPIGI
jgi:hypothetical protein